MTTPISSSDAVLSALAAQPAATQAKPSTSGISQDQFLKLFVTQLQHQDPLSPLEPDQITAQLAQFASLEQLTGVNTRLDQLAVVSQQTVLSLIGREVTFDGGQIALREGATPAVRYSLDAAADRATATVRASDGTVVRVVELGRQAVGAHEFRFDGKDAAGQKLPDGVYRVEVATFAGDQKAPTYPNLVVRDRVDGIDFSGEPPMLLVGGVRISLDQVREVHVANGTSSGS